LDAKIEPIDSLLISRAKEVREWSKDETSFVESFLKYEPSPPLFHALVRELLSTQLF